MRFLLIGCGRIAQQSHLPALRALGDAASVVAVCDADRERAERAAAAAGSGALVFTDPDAMLASAEADIPLLATPSGLHGRHAVAAARAGFHVVTEKPLAVSLADADLAIDECARRGKRLFVIEQVRLVPTVKRLAAHVRADRLGRLLFGQATILRCRPQSYFDEAPWRGRRDLDGGVLLNQASHYVAILLALLGDVRSVHAVTATLARSTEAEDTAVVLLRFANGAVGSVAATVLTSPRDLEDSVTIVGERGTVKLRGKYLDEIERWDIEPDRKSEPVFPGAPAGGWHAANLRRVVDALQGRPGDPWGLVEGVEARRTVELTEAIWRSAEIDAAVTLPLGGLRPRRRGAIGSGGER